MSRKVEIWYSCLVNEYEPNYVVPVDELKPYVYVEYDKKSIFIDEFYYLKECYEKPGKKFVFDDVDWRDYFYPEYDEDDNPGSRPTHFMSIEHLDKSIIEQKKWMKYAFSSNQYEYKKYWVYEFPYKHFNDRFKSQQILRRHSAKSIESLEISTERVSLDKWNGYAYTTGEYEGNQSIYKVVNEEDSYIIIRAISRKVLVGKLHRRGNLKEILDYVEKLGRDRKEFEYLIKEIKY